MWLHPGGIPGTTAILIRVVIFNADNITEPKGLAVRIAHLFVDTMASRVGETMIGLVRQAVPMSFKFFASVDVCSPV